MTAGPVSAVLRVDGLVRRFGTVRALDGLTFDVPAGRLVGFLGPNGAGKTTTMRAVFGLTELQAGTVMWDGRPIDAAQRRRFGYMPEERGLYPSMALGEQVEYFGRLHGMTAHDARTETAGWLGRLGLDARAGAKVESLSHGNQQRAQLAAALVHDPELLILDEPLAGLDPGGIDAVVEVLRERVRAGCGVLLSSHQLDLVEDICEAVVIIDHGRLVVTGTVDELATSGPELLRVRIDAVGDAEWAKAVPGVTVLDVQDGTAHLQLDETADRSRVLAAAMARGPVSDFGVVRRRLSEVFREATA
jgi:ABC-2 type transport system ATP-binding protein